jgi:hypothetical protein
VKIHPAWRALSVAAVAMVAFGLAWAWCSLGERQEAASRRDHVRRVLDVDGDLVKADILAARLAADFGELEWTARLRETTHALATVVPLIQQHMAAQARERLAPIVAQADAPAVAHFLYGRALIQLGETAAGEAEKAKARELAPESPIFRRSEGR